MQFSQIPGLQSLKNTLIQSVQKSHVSHAQLLYGTEGGMQLAMALAFATYINCENRTETDSCGQCAACSKMNKLAHPDFHSVYPIIKGSKIKAADGEDGKMANVDGFIPLWRQFLEESFFGSLADWHEQIGAEKNQQAIIPVEEARKILQKISLKPYEAEYKILLIWLPELMNNSAANAILKVLEEPPAKTIFLLVTNDRNKLLATILSRAVGVYVPFLTADDISQYLIIHKNVEPARANQIAQLADGNLLTATNLIEDASQDLFDNYSGWMRMCFKPDLVNLVKLADQFDVMERTTQKQLLEYSLYMLRNIFLLLNNTPSLVKLEGKPLEFVQNFAKAVRADQIDQIQLLINDCQYHLERNGRAKILFLDLSLQIAKIFKQK